MMFITTATNTILADILKKEFPETLYSAILLCCLRSYLQKSDFAILRDNRPPILNGFFVIMLAAMVLPLQLHMLPLLQAC